MFVKPMQSLPVAGVERQFEFGTSASQAILDRRQEMLDPLPVAAEMVSGGRTATQTLCATG
jgi:hypothetical protein